MNDEIDLKIVRLLGWTVSKVPLGPDGNRAAGMGIGHPDFYPFIEKYGHLYSVDDPRDYYNSAYRKLYSGYNDIWFKTEDEAWQWVVDNVYFTSTIDHAMSLFDGTGITVCLSKPPDQEEQYSAYLADHPAPIGTNLYSVSLGWAESICMCWLKYKVETES